MLAVALIGVLQILPSLAHLEHVALVPGQFARTLGADIHGMDMRGLPSALIGVLLLIMSVGLLFRSRLAWVLIVLMTLGGLVLQLLPDKAFQPVTVAVNGLLLVSLLVARRHFDRASLATATLYAVVGLLLALGYGVFGAYILGSQFSPPIDNFNTAIYFAVVTMSTVGYGDIVPHTPEARWFALSLIAFGLLVFVTSLTALIGPLMNQRFLNLLQPGKKPMRRRDHIIVVGDNPLARNTIRALSDRGLQTTAIWPQRPPEGSEVPADLLVGDAADAELLLTADADKARAVLALSEDDSDNAFVALAAKEVSERVRTVVAVSDVHNLVRVRRVRPDVVLALPVLGGELLAMTISGEKIEGDDLLRQLFKLD